uniref:NADH-ubiquinone oxidoreductase chain 4L n=1 Tax=Tenuidactylus dadunensis TaxID=3079921 RepID=A0AA96V4Y7_9SAUR|nr:NADH dehydrogenase subunit 4L [Tenuidactylus dadunensis]WNX96101.1 NADH dehydrogenase subunit 4L [Tenuidactylus dadunensis]
MMPLKFTVYTAFALSLTGLALCRKHLVSALLCLEGLMVALFTTLTTISQALATTTTMTQPIILLTLSACEAGVGLSLLVASSRTHASDHMKNLNLLMC